MYAWIIAIQHKKVSTRFIVIQYFVAQVHDSGNDTNKPLDS